MDLDERQVSNKMDEDLSSDSSDSDSGDEMEDEVVHEDDGTVDRLEILVWIGKSGGCGMYVFGCDEWDFILTGKNWNNVDSIWMELNIIKLYINLFKI